MKWFFAEGKEVKKEASLQALLEKECGEKVRQCYQCGKCSAGCPLSYEMDFVPNRIVRMIQLGMDEAVLASRTIWLCASCMTCTARCPREIDIAEIMDFSRRHAAKRAKIPQREAVVRIFNNVFLKNIEWFGRLYEMGLIAGYNLLSRRFFNNFALAPKMFLKRKIGILPPKVKNMGKLRDLIKESGRLEQPPSTQ